MEQETKLSLLEKIGCVGMGPIAGMLPPRIQQKIGNYTRNSYEASSLMSTTSRAVNGTLSGVAGITLIAKVFGADIDSNTIDLVTYVGTPLIVDTILREGFGALTYVVNGGSTEIDYFGPWGEPILSILDAKKNSEWYDSYSWDKKEEMKTFNIKFIN